LLLDLFLDFGIVSKLVLFNELFSPLLLFHFLSSHFGLFQSFDGSFLLDFLTLSFEDLGLLDYGHFLGGFLSYLGLSIDPLDFLLLLLDSGSSLNDLLGHGLLLLFVLLRNFLLGGNFSVDSGDDGSRVRRGSVD
jgi:hypothetical protein